MRTEVIMGTKRTLLQVVHGTIHVEVPCTPRER